MRHASPKLLLASLCLAATALPVAAQSDLSLIANPVQSDFRSISEDLVSALDYRALGPAEASGITGFSVGAFGSYSPVRDEGAWRRITGEKVEGLGMAGLSVTKGLPFRFDVGAFYSQVPSTDARLYGGELRWVPFEGGVATPAVAVRGTYTKLTGEDDLDMEATSADVSVSKGFAFITPYIGAGYTHGEVRPDSGFLLRDETVDQGKFFVGARITLGLLQLTPEYLRAGETNSYSVKLALGF